MFLVRGKSIVLTGYLTNERLAGLLSQIVSKDRERWFAARVHALKSWPEMTPQQIIDAASNISPRRLMDGKWAWPSRELDIQRKLLKSAPEDAIDIDALRYLLEQMDDYTAERLIELLAESRFLEFKTEPLDNGLPEPKEIPLGLLRRLKRLHGAISDMLLTPRVWKLGGKMFRIGCDPDAVFCAEHDRRAGGLMVPIANQRSPAGTVADDSE
jgi:hypothetical protein